MSISRFDDISNLVGYWSGAESTIGKSGDDVTSWDLVYRNDNSLAVTQATPSGSLPAATHNPSTINVGQCPAIYFPEGGGTLDVEPTALEAMTDDAFTVCCLYQLDAIDTGGTVYQIRNNNSASHIQQFRNGSENWWKLNNSNRDTGIVRTLNPERSIVAWNKVTGTAKAWINDVSGPLSSATTANNLRQIQIGGTSSAGGAGGQKIAKLVIYNKFLTDEEATFVLDLLQYWELNGEAPSLGPPTSGDFTITVDKPGAAGLAFQWEESSDNTNWANAGTAILSDVSNTTTATMTVNSAATGEHGTYVRCQVTTTDDGFDTSDSAQLLIDGQ